MDTALLVIDMQNDYLYEKRKKRFSYDTQQLVSSVNELIHEYESSGCDVLHICGPDECGCVTSTALGAAKRGFRAEIVRKGTASVFPAKRCQRLTKGLIRQA